MKFKRDRSRSYLDRLPAFWTTAASICLIVEACIQVALRIELHYIVEACNMALLLALIILAWIFFLMRRPRGARYLYRLYAWELIIDTVVMASFHTHFYSPSHCLLQCGLACIILALCKRREP